MRKMYYLMLMLLLMCTASLNAQVKIGSQDNPHSGALLDLKNEGVNKGLLLPNVTLNSDLTIFVLDEDSENGFTKTNATGMVVFNLADKKVYVWDGAKWSAISGNAGGTTEPEPETVIPPTVSGVTKVEASGRYDFNGDGLLAEDEIIDFYIFNADNSTGIKWSTVDVEYYEATSMVDGLANCEKALASKSVGTQLPAIKICDDLNTTAPGTGGKWYLPAAGEFLPALANYIKSTGGAGKYWTSTEYNWNNTGAEDVYQVTIETLAKQDCYKTENRRVRCVWRANNPTKVQ